MKVTNNLLLTGVSGKLSNLVVKQYQDKTIVTTRPDMSRRKLTPKQKEVNERMSLAIFAAKAYTASPHLKQRACDTLKVPPNKVFRAIVSHYMLTNGEGPLFEMPVQEKLDSITLAELKKIITKEIPDAAVQLYGTRARGLYDGQSDWDLLILTTRDYSPTIKWKLQEKLCQLTMQKGTRVNILLVPSTTWNTAPEYKVLRKRLEQELKKV